MDTLINITSLSGFLFCPYSIYLENVFSDMDDDVYVAVPQVRGKAAHKKIDTRKLSTDKDDVQSLKVWSEELGLVGVIDLYRKAEEHLVEFKYRVGETLFLRQKVQLWAQCYCLREMGYDVKRISVYETSTGTFHSVPLPNDEDRKVLEDLIMRFRNYDFASPCVVNPKKCTHCVYCSLCHFADSDNVYT